MLETLRPRQSMIRKSGYPVFRKDHAQAKRRVEQVAVTGACSRKFQGCFNSAPRGYTMPAFTFEKISPPIRRGPIPPIAKKQRGVIVKILDRLVEARVKRTSRKQKGVTARRQKKPQD
jgi:hypothetical protein